MTIEARFREISERSFQKQVTGLAQMLRWHWLYIRPAPEVSRRTGEIARYTTPTTGTLAKGWPDLTIIHETSGRIIFAELKSEVGKVSLDQQRVLDALRLAGHEVYVWRPHDIDEIERVLRRD